MAAAYAKALVPGYYFDPAGSTTAHGNNLVCDYLLILNPDGPVTDSQFPLRREVVVAVGYGDKTRDVQARIAEAINANPPIPDLAGHIDVEFLV